MSFSQKLENAIRAKRTPVLVGLDPRRESMPQEFQSLSVGESFRKFCCDVIDVVAPLVPAVKPQIAFFEQYGIEGLTALTKIIAYARERGLIIILDAKRNDIGTTAAAYAEGMLGSESAWGADALTVSPYLGDDSLSPFLDIATKRDAGVFCLVKTSNAGGAMLQDLVANDETIYRHVARYVEEHAAKTARESGTKYGALGAVVGATWAEQLIELRAAMPHAWLLIPGYGSQGGSARDVAGGFDADGLGAIVNNSRGIIFAHQKRSNISWQRAVEEATQEMIAALRSETTAARL